jgi:Undecaprenyl-phosphate glucose phosphotransferase
MRSLPFNYQQQNVKRCLSLPATCQNGYCQMAARRGSGTTVRATNIASAAVIPAGYPDYAAGERRGSTRLSTFITTLVLQEFFVVAASTYLASALYQIMVFQEWPPASIYIASALFVGFVVVTVSIASGRYINLQRHARHTFLWSGLGAVALAFSFLLSGLFLLKIAQPYSRATFVMQLVIVGFAVLTNRAMAYARLQSATAKGRVEAQRVVLVGDAIDCARFAARLTGTGISLVGSFPFPTGGSAGAAAGAADQSAHGLVNECRRVRPDDVLILTNHDTVMQASGLAASLSELPAGLHLALVESADLLSAARVVEFGNTVTLQVAQPPLSILDRVVKRAFDVVVALAALVILSPFMLLVSVAIKLDSRGPVLFRQMRHGYNSETIQVFKFRTMTVWESEETFVQATRGDRRVTRLGRFLRRTNIDELPQLINVLQGQMSIVGPRPHATAHNEMFEKRISIFSRRHTVKPGITGWAQVNGYRGETDTVEKMKQRVEYDLYYIDNWSLLFDLRIIIMTLLSKSAYDNAY